MCYYQAQILKPFPKYSTAAACMYMFMYRNIVMLLTYMYDIIYNSGVS
jgi:hypothetical protein